SGFFFQAEDGIRDFHVTGVQTCALPIWPAASSSTTASTKAVRLYIDNSGQVYLDGTSIQPWVIQTRLRDLLKSKTQKSVLVVTDENVPSGKLVEVVDQARLAGASDVGVATEKEVGA